MLFRSLSSFLSLSYFLIFHSFSFLLFFSFSFSFSFSFPFSGVKDATLVYDKFSNVEKLLEKVNKYDNMILFIDYNYWIVDILFVNYNHLILFSSSLNRNYTLASRSWIVGINWFSLHFLMPKYFFHCNTVTLLIGSVDFSSNFTPKILFSIKITVSYFLKLLWLVEWCLKFLGFHSK